MKHISLCNTKKKVCYFLLFLLITQLITNSCTQEDEEIITPVSYTLLIYMAADNSMDSEVDYTLSELKAGMKRSGGATIVYLDRADETPRLFSISSNGEETTLKTYAEENSASAETLARVIEETKELAPAEKFAFVYWSHAMGWVPSGYSKETKTLSVSNQYIFPRTRYLGMDQHLSANTSGLSLMEIDEMANTLPDDVAEYILFDACLMGSVEALYQLRNKCHYFIASPAEMLMEGDYDASGMPYSKILPLLFGDETNLVTACEKYYNHYNSKEESILRSATITLIDASQLEALYATTNNILSGRLSAVANINTDDVQVYHRGSLPAVFFDLSDVMKQLSTTTQYNDFLSQLNKTIIYKAATDMFANDLALESCCGLSVYIPFEKWENNTEYFYYFNSMLWSGVYNK